MWVCPDLMAEMCCVQVPELLNPNLLKFQTFNICLMFSHLMNNYMKWWWKLLLLLNTVILLNWIISVSFCEKVELNCKVVSLKQTGTLWPCLSSTKLVCFYVSRQLYCAVWGWGSLPPDGQCKHQGPQCALRGQGLTTLTTYYLYFTLFLP